MEHEKRRLTNPAEALAFMLAGNSTFTLRSTATGNRLTFKIQAVKERRNDGPTHFVKLLNGPDNTANYIYLGMIRSGKFEHGRKSAIGSDAASAKAIRWTIANLSDGNMPANLEIWHEGRCGRCGRVLTVPESIASGYGPECSGRMAA